MSREKKFFIILGACFLLGVVNEYQKQSNKLARCKVLMEAPRVSYADQAACRAWLSR